MDPYLALPQLARRRGTVLRVAPNDLGVGSTPTCGATRLGLV